jgi:hypothetical protein
VTGSGQVGIAIKGTQKDLRDVKLLYLAFKNGDILVVTLLRETR